MDGLSGMRQPREGESQPDYQLSYPRPDLFSTKRSVKLTTAVGGLIFVTSYLVGNIIHPTLGRQSVDPSLKELPTTIARECENVIRDSRSQIHYLLDRDDFGHPLTLVSRNNIGSGQHENHFLEDTCAFMVHEHDGATGANIGFGTVQKHYEGDDSVQLSIHKGESAATSQQDTSLLLQLDKKFDNFQGENSSYSLFWPRRGNPHYVEKFQEKSRSVFRTITSLFGFRPKLDVDTSWKKSSSNVVISAAQNLQNMVQRRLQDTIRQEEATPR